MEQSSGLGQCPLWVPILVERVMRARKRLGPSSKNRTRKKNVVVMNATSARKSRRGRTSTPIEPKRPFGLFVVDGRLNDHLSSVGTRT